MSAIWGIFPNLPAVKRWSPVMAARRELPSDDERYCSRCHKTKPVDAFANGKGETIRTCRECQDQRNEYARANYDPIGKGRAVVEFPVGHRVFSWTVVSKRFCHNKHYFQTVECVCGTRRRMSVSKIAERQNKQCLKCAAKMNGVWMPDRARVDVAPADVVARVKKSKEAA